MILGKFPGKKATPREFSLERVLVVCFYRKEISS
jgi:hypothetical protein